MPTTYTHDLFGKKVYQQLPKEMQEIIRKHGNLYRIGLHGPDILFYQLLKSRVNRFGVQMHNEKAREFFQQGMATVRETGDERLLAYMLGFGCHYLLDSTCHPFVNQMAEEKIINHTLLEKEFDRVLMEEQDLDPLLHHPADALVPKKAYAKVIHMVMPLMSVCDIYESLVMQKFFLNLMVYGRNGMMKKAAGLIFGHSSKEDTREFADHFMRRYQAEESYEPIRTLKQLFADAELEAPRELKQLFDLSRQEFTLTERWNRTYNG